MRIVLWVALGLLVAGCGNASAPVDAGSSARRPGEAPVRTDRLPSAEPGPRTERSPKDYPPVPGNPAGIGTPPFHNNLRS